jgi:hypothetical protein
VTGESTARFAGELSLAAVLAAVIAVLVSFGLGLKLDRMEQSIRDLDDQLSDRPYLKMCLVEIFRLATDQSARDLTNSQWNTGVERWLVEGRGSADVRARGDGDGGVPVRPAFCGPRLSQLAFSLRTTLEQWTATSARGGPELRT